MRGEPDRLIRCPTLPWHQAGRSQRKKMHNHELDAFERPRARRQARSCDALELVIVPRVRDLGGFQVRRALPHGKRQMVGPFIFFDQMGPVQFVAGQGMDVRPHPHIGLATVTYLFDGRVMHRDSEGNALEITPGAMNLMTAGRGIAHSERTPDEVRRAGGGMFGIQSWIALPSAHEEIDPSFQHFDAATPAGRRATTAYGRA